MQAVDGVRNRGLSVEISPGAPIRGTSNRVASRADYTELDRVTPRDRTFAHE